MFVLMLAGCGGDREATVTDIPRAQAASAEESAYGSPAEPAPPPPAVPGGGVASMVGANLPSSAVNTDSANPNWQVPDGWQPGQASAMRRGSFTAAGSYGNVDISVTSFPGDVGGLLANINRWRGQVGLNPIGPGELEAAIERRQVHGKEAVITHMENRADAMSVAIFEHAGNSWFIRMAGPTATVREQAQSFNQFVNSIEFPQY